MFTNFTGYAGLAVFSSYTHKNELGKCFAVYITQIVYLLPKIKKVYKS